MMMMYDIMKLSTEKTFVGRGCKKMLAIILIQTFLLTVLTISGCGGGAGGGSSSVIPGGSGSAILTWDAPTTNDDPPTNTCLTDLAGYKVHYGKSSVPPYSNVQTIPKGTYTCVDTGIDAVTGCGNIFNCTYTVNDLAPGTWYSAITAYDTSGNESSYSNVVSTTI
jgi:hypothetical protein